MTAATTEERSPLRGLRVVSLADDKLPSLSRSLADLGADVEVLALGPEDRPLRPLQAMLERRGKRYVDLPAEAPDRHSLVSDRLSTAAVLLITPAAATAVGYGSLDELAAAHPRLVVAAVSDFGLDGPRGSWTGTDAVYNALSGILSRSGEPGRPPLLPPGEMFVASATQEILWGVLASVHGTVAQGASPDASRGTVLDCSIFEAGLACLDPAYGMAGSGTPDNIGSDDRPDAARIYPIFEVRDGYVRTCVLAKNQWLALRDWMGNPEPLMSEEFLTNPGRWAAKDLIVPLQQEFFAQLSTAEVVEESRRRKIPAAAVLSPADVHTEEHYRATGTLREIGQVDGKPVVAPVGMVRVDGYRLAAPAGPAAPDPALPGWPAVAEDAGNGPYPLSGITVLDLGVIVAGAQAGQLFAQMGARVIRIENTAFPDGMRRSFEWATPALARGHRGKESVGLDLRSEEGRALFLEMAARADVVLSNFKPGTVERLGISYDDLTAVNPSIICLESSAFGDTGPWRTAMGYGPLVRAATGQSWLWREGPESDYFADGITIFPDHLVGRVCATATLACVLDRRRTGRGAHLTVAQSDIALEAMAEFIASESIAPGSTPPPGDPVDHLLGAVLFPAAGSDQWCAVDPFTPAQVEALRGLIGAQPDAQGDAGPDAGLTAAVAEWVRARPAAEAAAALQAVGVPAGHMVRHPELLDDPALVARGMYETTLVPGIGDEIPVERQPVLSRDLQLPDLAPMAMFGAHTRNVLEELGHSPGKIREWLARGVAQESNGVTNSFEARPAGGQQSAASATQD